MAACRTESFLSQVLPNVDWMGHDCVAPRSDGGLRAGPMTAPCLVLIICSCSRGTYSQAWLSARYTPCKSPVRMGATGHPGSSLQLPSGVYTSPFFWPTPPE